MPVPISGIINTFNEEANIATALRSLTPWVDEVIVVDMNSTDRTAAIAASMGARVVPTDGAGVQYAAREFALQQATHEWVFVLDADELVPLTLAREINRLVEAGQWDAIYIPRCNYHFGAVLEHSQLAPQSDLVLRLFRLPYVAGSSTAHRDFAARPGARELRMPYEKGAALIHFNYVDTVQYVDKLNRYTTVEAVQAKIRGERATIANLIYAPAREFLSRYVIHRGYRDGWRGLHVALLMAFYRAVQNLKLRELERAGSRAEILELYRRQADALLGEYLNAGYELRARSAPQPIKA